MQSFFELYYHKLFEFRQRFKQSNSVPPYVTSHSRKILRCLGFVSSGKTLFNKKLNISARISQSSAGDRHPILIGIEKNLGISNATEYVELFHFINTYYPRKLETIVKIIEDEFFKKINIQFEIPKAIPESGLE
jgi:hypothetical protein